MRTFFCLFPQAKKSPTFSHVCHTRVCVCVCVFSYVRRVADFGVFVRIHGTERTDALCHISECADAVLKELKKAFSEGDLVKGVILKTNPEKKQVYTPPPP